MERYAIKRPDFLNIIDNTAPNNFSYGLTQEWYKDKYQVLAGCGATVASTILSYYEQNKNFKNLKKEDVLTTMEELWEYLLPIKGMGLYSTELFYEGIKKYASEKNLNLSYNYLNINLKIKPNLEEVVDYLKAELLNDRPVAFLNLCNGEEEALDKWHWVTVYEIFEEDNEYYLNIFDDREIKKINLSLWYNTIQNDGGFVSFYFE